MYVSFSWLVGRDAEILKSVTRVNQLKELGMCLFHKLKVAYIVNIIAIFFFFFLLYLLKVWGYDMLIMAVIITLLSLSRNLDKQKVLRK